jgi:hypothetical protein
MAAAAEESISVSERHNSWVVYTSTAIATALRHMEYAILDCSSRSRIKHEWV